MNFPRAPKPRGVTPAFWALGLLMFLLHACHGCTKDVATPLESEQCKTIEQNTVANAKLLHIFTECRGQKGADVPVLYAHFLQQSLKDDICIEDIMANTGGRHFCAPGPFKIDNGSSIDFDEKQWTLDQMPDYFVWHLNPGDTTEENLLITNQNGFPIKSQTFKLQNDGETILVLLPNKKSITPSGRYFIYLTKNTKESSSMWIQPLSSVAANSSKKQ